MTAVRTWEFLLLILVLITNMHSALPLSIDLLLEDDTGLSCPTPVICSQHFGEKSRITNLTWMLYTKDLFTGAKTVHALQGQIIIKLSLTACQQSYSYSQSRLFTNRSCLINCTELFNQRKPVFIQEIVKPLKAPRLNTVQKIGQLDNKMNMIVDSIQSIITHQKWTKHTVLSSQKALKALSSGLRSSQLLFTLDEGSDFNHILDDTYRLLTEKDLNFVAVCSTQCILKLLHQAYLLEAEKFKRSRWLVVPADKNSEDLEHLQTQIKTDDVVIVTFPRCSKHYSLFDLDDIEYHLSLIAHQNETTYSDNLIGYVEKMSRSYNSEVIANIYLTFPTPRGLSLKKGGHVGLNEEVIVTENLFPGMKYGFNNRTLVTAVLEDLGMGSLELIVVPVLVKPWPPYVYKEVNNGSISYSGVAIDLLKELALRLNFSYEIIEPEDQQWGHVLDGKWTGLVGMMTEKKADFAVAPVAVNTFRAKVMDFTVPYYYVQSTVLLKTPDPNTNKWMTLVSPFRYEVHICVLLSLICSTVLLFVTEELNPVNNWTDIGVLDRRRRYGNILWYHFGALMANGGAYLPHTNSGRTVLTCWWLFTVISAATYSGNLIAFLTDWREATPFSTLTEMVEQDTYQWGTIGGGVLIDILKNSNRSEYRQIWNGLQDDSKNDPDVLSTDNDVHLQKVLTGHYAFISDETVLELWESEHCNLNRLKEEFFVMIYAVGLPKNSIYTDIFSKHILRISESGLVDTWLRRWMPKSPCETAMSSKRVDLLALQSVFYAAGVGILLALIVLMTECAYDKICLKQVLPENDNNCGRLPHCQAN